MRKQVTDEYTQQFKHFIHVNAFNPQNNLIKWLCASPQPPPCHHPLWGQASLLERMLQAKDDSAISGVNNLASPAKRSEADIAQAGCGKRYLLGKFIAPVILHNSINHLALHTENSVSGRVQVTERPFTEHLYVPCSGFDAGDMMGERSTHLLV